MVYDAQNIDRHAAGLDEISWATDAVAPLERIIRVSIIVRED